MSESTAKNVRRDLRRAFGVQAVDTINKHARTFGTHEEQLANAQLRIDKLEGEVDELRQASAYDHAAIDVLKAWRARGFWLRLRYLVLGR